MMLQHAVILDQAFSSFCIDVSNELWMKAVFNLFTNLQKFIWQIRLIVKAFWAFWGHCFSRPCLAVSLRNIKTSLCQLKGFEWHLDFSKAIIHIFSRIQVYASGSGRVCASVFYTQYPIKGMHDTLNHFRKIWNVLHWKPLGWIRIAFKSVQIALAELKDTA